MVLGYKIIKLIAFAGHTYKIDPDNIRRIDYCRNYAGENKPSFFIYRHDGRTINVADWPHNRLELKEYWNE